MQRQKQNARRKKNAERTIENNAERKKMQKQQSAKTMIERASELARLRWRIKRDGGAIGRSKVEEWRFNNGWAYKKPKKEERKALNWTRKNRPWFSKTRGSTAVRTIHWFFCICQFLELKELFWWMVSGLPGQTIWYGSV